MYTYPVCWVYVQEKSSIKKLVRLNKEIRSVQERLARLIHGQMGSALIRTGWQHLDSHPGNGWSCSEVQVSASRRA